MTLTEKQWAELGARAAFDGVAETEILSWLQQQPEFAAAETGEDSESSSLSWAARAADILEDVRTRPLTDPQAIELAKGYALLAIHERLSSATPSELIATLTHTTPGA